MGGGRKVTGDEIPLLSMLICLFNDAGWGEFVWL